MAVNNSLGSETFRFWLGAPLSAPRQQVEVFSHPGTDYETYRWIGQRMPQQSRNSIVDVATIAEGRAKYAAYRALIVTSPHQLVWNDYDYDLENLRVVVQDVEIVSLQQKLSICGALVPGNTVDLTCRWTMRLIPTA